jgi:hypothetical protein
MAALFSTSTDGGFRHQIVVDGASPYSWASFAWLNTTGVPTHMLAYDPIVTPTAADVDPVMIYICGVVATQAAGGTTAGTHGVGQYGTWNTAATIAVRGYVNGAWSTTTYGPVGFIWNGGAYVPLFPSFSIANDDSKDDCYQLLYIHYNTVTGKGFYKGYSTLFYWEGVARTTGSTLSVTGTKDRVVLCDVTLPWDGSDATI